MLLLEKCCSNCLYYLTKSPVGGICRRFPRVPIGRMPGNSKHIDQVYPYVHKDEWCGEWKEKK